VTTSESTPASIHGLVHFSFDPTPSNEKGIFVMPDAEAKVVEAYPIHTMF
jgi:hypothetical protein